MESECQGLGFDDGIIRGEWADREKVLEIEKLVSIIKYIGEIITPACTPEA